MIINMLEYDFTESIGNKFRKEWRMELSENANNFLREMKEKGFPPAKLVSFIIEQAIPSYKPKKYTYEGYNNCKQNIRTLY